MQDGCRKCISFIPGFNTLNNRFDSKFSYSSQLYYLSLFLVTVEDSLLDQCIYLILHNLKLHILHRFLVDLVGFDPIRVSHVEKPELDQICRSTLRFPTKLVQ